MDMDKTFASRVNIGELLPSSSSGMVHRQLYKPLDNKLHVTLTKRLSDVVGISAISENIRTEINPRWTRADSFSRAESISHCQCQAL